VAGIVNSTGENTTDSTAGGDVTTAGQDGSISGNVASLQALPIAQVFGLAAAGTGLVHGTGQNDSVVTSGGDIMTNGDRGSISGNLVDVPAAAVAQVFGDAAAIGGTAVGLGPNETTAVTGGTDMTSGKGGNLSGNLATVPAAAIAQVFGNAVSAGGHAIGIAPNDTTALVGGHYETDGSLKTLSGIKKVVPVGVVAQVFDIPVPIVAHALTSAPNNTIVKVDDTAPMFDLPIGGGGLPINKLPSLRGLLAKSQSRSDSARPGAGKVPGGSALSSLDATRVLPSLNMVNPLSNPELG
jgi:hypothetical protein